MSHSAYERGNALFVNERYEEAAREYSAAIIDGIDGIDGDGDGADLYENLGLTLWKLGRWRPAARALLRTLDGQPTRREQTLRVLVSCLFRDGRPLDGERLLRIYEQAFGPHPEAWKKS